MIRFASYDGTQLAYTEVGSGPSLICLPGGPGRAAEYLGDLGGLTGERTLVRLDARATGHSEVPVDPASLRFDRLPADVEALRTHLGQDRMAVLGHSAGCLVAQLWAARHPDRVAALVLVTPTARLQGSPHADVASIRSARASEDWYDDAAAAAAALDSAPPAQQQALMRATRPFFYGRWDDVTAAHAASADRQSSKRAQLGFTAGSDSMDLVGVRAALGRLDVPVLVVGGERDGLTGVEAIATVAADFPAAQQVVLPRAGHFPWVDEPAAFVDAVGGFLSAV